MMAADGGTGNLGGLARALLLELSTSWRRFDDLPYGADELKRRGLAQFERRRTGPFGVRRWYGRRTAAGESMAPNLPEPGRW